jgi:hypothetical protein
MQRIQSPDISTNTNNHNNQMMGMNNSKPNTAERRPNSSTPSAWSIPSKFKDDEKYKQVSRLSVYLVQIKN